MNLGRIGRILLGPLFPLVGRAYRRVFVDLDKVAAAFPTLPPKATVLDVGGGDGAVIDRVLARQPDLRVIMVDISPRIGAMLHPSRKHKVTCLPSTEVGELAARKDIAVDVAILSDVLHHVPPAQRSGLLRDVLSAFGERPRCLIVKDIEPTGWRAALSLFCDRYVSGDRGTCLLGRDELIQLLHEVDPTLEVHHTNLFCTDSPNYAIVFGPLSPQSTAVDMR